MKTSSVVVAMFLVLFVGQAYANFVECYAHCYFDCIKDARKKIPFAPEKFRPCAWKCVKHCIFHSPLANQDKCILGCSMDSCADFYNDPAKMEDCVGECSTGYCSAQNS
ncbi:hypothetical protein M0R45_031717 [Rubus argutus]|uniref:Protein TAP1-like n=1 Tax=Rubus argutus TaxID=59490 RepID=A0AAW1WET2_RUBAR